MLPPSPMSYPHVVGGQPAGGPPERLGRAGLAGNPDLAQNSLIDFRIHVWIPDRYVRE